jgi:hypothetical protein
MAQPSHSLPCRFRRLPPTPTAARSNHSMSCTFVFGRIQPPSWPSHRQVWLLQASHISKEAQAVKQLLSLCLCRLDDMLPLVRVLHLWLVVQVGQAPAQEQLQVTDPHGPALRQPLGPIDTPPIDYNLVVTRVSTMRELAPFFTFGSSSRHSRPSLGHCRLRPCRSLSRRIHLWS